jgi:hypothetical protein
MTWALALTFAYPVASNDPADEFEAPVAVHWMGCFGSSSGQHVADAAGVVVRRWWL